MGLKFSVRIVFFRNKEHLRRIRKGAQVNPQMQHQGLLYWAIKARIIALLARPRGVQTADDSIRRRCIRALYLFGRSPLAGVISFNRNRAAAAPAPPNECTIEVKWTRTVAASRKNNRAAQSVLMQHTRREMR